MHSVKADFSSSDEIYVWRESQIFSDIYQNFFHLVNKMLQIKVSYVAQASKTKKDLED